MKQMPGPKMYCFLPCNKKRALSGYLDNFAAHKGPDPWGGFLGNQLGQNISEFALAGRIYPMDKQWGKVDLDD